ncbi:MAG: dienelactone hydrolase [Deltaproteobacteria bacterium]|nr:dienelactone hydrolase [Deltaproteobacteria bacterium]
MMVLVTDSLCSSALAAGISKIEVPAVDREPALHAMVWSPCATASIPVQIGPLTVQGVCDCAVEGNKLPLVVISHGKGASLLSHHDTASVLTDAGFVVATLNHPGDFFGDETSSRQLKIFETRPHDISRLISFMTQQWQHRDRLDSNAIGVFGFSRGGYTALVLAGATPSTLAGAKHLCNHLWSLVDSLCRQFKAEGSQLHPQADPRIRAAVVVDPLNLFDARGLQSVHIPVQLWASEQGGDGVKLEHTEEIRDALPQLSDYHVARGAGHFAYLAPCSPTLKKANPGICIDPNGFDRTAWHLSMNTAVVTFFKQKLLPNP